MRADGDPALLLLPGRLLPLRVVLPGLDPGRAAEPLGAEVLLPGRVPRETNEVDEVVFFLFSHKRVNND